MELLNHEYEELEQHYYWICFSEDTAKVQQLAEHPEKDLSAEEALEECKFVNDLGLPQVEP